MVAAARKTKPAARQARRSRLPLALVQPPEPQTYALPRLEFRERRGSVLRVHSWSDVGPDEVDGINLTAGCGHRCSFCAIRSYVNYPGNDVLIAYTNTADVLRAELAQRKRLPHAILLSPAADPFAPFAQVQNEALRVLEVLAEFGIEAWFQTRGFIRPTVLEGLVRHKKLVRVTMALTTVDRALSRALEPFAAPPHLRLKQIRHLRELGIPVNVAAEPLIPGLTDTRHNVEPLVQALADAGVQHVTASYLFLRSGIQEQIERDLGDQGWAQAIIERYANGPVLSMGRIAAARHLPRADRQAGYALLMTLAARYGMQVRVSGLTNPDFTRRRDGPPAGETLRQMLLKYPKG